MMKCRPRRDNAAFAFIEFLILVISLIVLLLMIAPAMRGTKGKSPRVKCTGNLKQIALAYFLWANDNAEGLPMEVPTAKGGIREAALAGDLLSVIRVASNHMRTPMILICPGEKKRKPAETFASLTTANICYFLNANAALTNQNHILAGDRNLSVTGSPVKPGPLEITNPSDVQWANWLHEGGGNVGLVDGSAHQVTTKGLRDLLNLSATNHILVP